MSLQGTINYVIAGSSVASRMKKLSAKRRVVLRDTIHQAISAAEIEQIEEDEQKENAYQTQTIHLP